MASNNDMFLLFGLAVLLWLVVNPSRGCQETYDNTTTEFVPVGSQRYDLRGLPLRKSSMNNVYLSPNRHIRLTSTGGEMYIDSRPPVGNSCSKVPCPPLNDAYDAQDTCWKCSEPERPAEQVEYNNRYDKFVAGCRPFAVDGYDQDNLPPGWPRTGHIGCPK